MRKGTSLLALLAVGVLALCPMVHADRLWLNTDH